jgi:tetratricopeptide (TPR) repeat protein
MLLFLSSCSGDFIDFLPTSAVTADVIYKTDKDYLDALTGVYSPIRDQYRDFFIFGDVRADDSWVEIAKNNSASYSDRFTLNSGDGLLNNTWLRYYQAIFRANTILSKIESANDADVPNKKRYIAEAHFLRALCYFDLVRIFGDVPAITVPVTIEESYLIVREPVANIYNNIIIPDFQAAESSLPVSYSAIDEGRPTVGAAKALLGRVYLTIKDYSKAESKLNEVTTIGYQLLADYNDLFDYSNKRHSEYIFNIEYESGVNGGSNYTNAFMPNFIAMTTFFGISGYGDEWNSPTRAFYDLFEENDLRKEISVGLYGGYYDANEEFVPIPTNTNQTYTKKYITQNPARNDSRADWKVIRYADVLLMLAEAMNENGKTQDGISYLNQIRERAGVSVYPTTMSQIETRDAIAKERRLELSFEGVRWFDLVRTGKVYEVMNEFGMNEYMNVFPLPLSQVQLINDPAILPQNPGYN